MKLNILLLLFLISNSTFAISHGIYNFEKAANGIYRGARPLDESEILSLKDKGIKSIVNLQGGDMKSSLWNFIFWNEPGEKLTTRRWEESTANANGLNFVNFPLNSLDAVSSEDDRRIKEALSFMSNKSNWPIYVHCEHGVDRTGLVIALYKIVYEKMDIGEAYREWEAKGHDSKSRLFTGNLDDYFVEFTK